MSIPLLDECESLITYVAAAREIVQSGYMPDLKGLDERVADLCAALTLTDPDTKQACLPKLTLFLESLNICENEMSLLHKLQIRGRA